MKIDEVRTSFTAYLIASDMSRLEGIAESMRMAGYMAAAFTELTSAFSEFPSNPPHFLLFDALESQFNLKKAIRQVAAQLPESHVFVVAPSESRGQVIALYDVGVYDIIYTPVASEKELLRALDRAAERDYLMYLNERLAQGAKSAGATESAPEEDDVVSDSPLSAGGVREILMPDTRQLHGLRELLNQKTADECIHTFMQSVSGILGSCGAVYFKFFNNRRILMAMKSCHLPEADLSGLGVNFNESATGFRTAQLREPKKIPELNQMIAEVFSVNDYLALTVESLAGIQGIVVFLHPQVEKVHMGWLEDWKLFLHKALDLLESEKRLHTMTVKDPSTDLLNRQNFLSHLHKEINRARRTQTPVALALLSLDQYERILSEVGHEEAQTVMRMAARIFEKHSRINDVLGRTGPNEFGLVLPHTGKDGAIVKLERLRRMIESADFSKVIKDFPQITISVGVSEYPSFVRDTEELVNSADEALAQVRKVGNKTCVTTAPEGFTPDFKIRDRGLG